MRSQGSLAQSIGAAVGVAAVTTAFVAAAWRYVAVLRQFPQQEVERATARGFFIGLVGSVAIFLLDQFGA